MSTNADEPAHDYVETFYSLRAPRVAVVFPGDTDDWHFFAKFAMWQANQLWGGAGFVLVPHRAGLVNVQLLRAVAVYDPDYVVGINVSWKELLTAYPPARSTFTDSDGSPVDFEKLTLDANDVARSVHTEAARDAVAAVCQVYRRREHETEGSGTTDARTVGKPADPRWDDGWANSDESCMSLNDPQHLTPVSVFGLTDYLCVAAPANLQGPWGAWAAAVAGTVDRPALPSPAAGPPVDAEELTEWFYAGLQERHYGTPTPPSSLAHSPGQITMSLDTSILPSAWTRTTRGLVSVTRRRDPDQVTLVVGDAPEDFALALIYERMWGNALWIHSAWSPSASGSVGLRARAATAQLWPRIQRLSRSTVTSVSANKSELDKICALVNRNGGSIELFGAPAEAEKPVQEGGPPLSKYKPVSSRHRARGQLEPASPPDFARSGIKRLAVNEEFSIRTTVPVLRTDDTVVMTTTPPALRPSDPDLVSVDLNWQVDIRMVDEHMPLGRGLDGHVLVASADLEFETWVRSGSDGVSYENKRYDFVSSGANTEQRLARPRIRFLAIHEWVRTKAEQAGYSTAWSDAGRRAWLLQRMIGGREQFRNEVASRFTDVAVAFNRPGRATKDAYPDNIGVKLSGSIGYLTFAGIRDVLLPSPARATVPTQDVPTGQVEDSETTTGSAKSANAESDAVTSHDAPAATAEPVEQGAGEESAAELQVRNQQARSIVDRLLQAGLLRRGLILGCATCDTGDFVAVDDLAQSNECRRCGAMTAFTAGAWRQPVDEPTWFYDLHPVARKFFQDNGHAPIWLANHLATKAREYTDCAELNLLLPGTRKSVAEADLIANVDGTLITAEVKTSNSLGNKNQRADAAEKRVRWAAVVQADEIVLATTMPAWEQTSVDTMRRHLTAAIVSGVFSPGRSPRLRLIAGLHTASVTDIYVDLDPQPGTSR